MLTVFESTELKFEGQTTSNPAVLNIFNKKQHKSTNGWMVLRYIYKYFYSAALVEALLAVHSSMLWLKGLSKPFKTLQC